MLLLVSIACGERAAEAGPTPWEWEEEAEERSVLEGDALESGLDEVIAALLRLDPQAVHDAYEAALAHTADGCPETTSAGTSTNISGDCSTQEGFAYYGNGQLNRLRDHDVQTQGIDAYHRTFDWATGVVRVLGPDDYLVEIMGDASYRDFDDDDGEAAFDGMVWGEFHAVRADLAETWLAEDLSVEVHTQAVAREGANEIAFQGGISRLGGVAWATVFDLALSETACASEPDGTVWVQEQGADWAEVVFDGTTSCDGCSADGVCADFSPLVAWSDRPWG